MKVIENGDEVETYQFTQPAVRLGRDSTNDLVIGDPFISASHGRVQRYSSGFVYEDLHTTNGSIIRRNGLEIHVNDDLDFQVQLEDGDELRYSAGVVFNWFSPIGPFSLSYGEPLNDEEGDEIENFQISFGTVFR